MKFVLRLVAAVTLAAGVLSIPAHASATPVAASTATGFSQIAGCISGADNLLVSIVVDESLSLRQTDPTALRVQGITTAIDSLEQLTAAVSDSTQVEVSMSTFARSYSPLMGWQRLDAGTAEHLRSTAEKTLPARDAGDATDYRQALLGAKKQLDARQRQLGDPRACKLLLWFTDGALDVDAQTSVAAQELCQVGGIADAVRKDGISVVALALFKPGAGVTQHQRDVLRALAEGTGGGTICGAHPIASDSATGVYLPADDPASLQRLFAGAGALVAGGTEVETATCPGRACRSGTYRLQIDRGVAGARVLVQSASPPNVEITTPSGRNLRIDNGATERADGATVSYLVRDHLATINISYDPYTKARSTWLLHGSRHSELTTYWFWGAQLSLRTREVRAGASTELTVAVLDQNGDPLPPGLYQSTRSTIEVNGTRLKTQVTREGLLEATLRLGVEDLPSNVPITASLGARSAPGDVLLGPVSLSRRFPVTLPPSYPSVTPKELDFGRLKGVGTANANLSLTGSELGPTQVCVVRSTTSVPGQQPRSDLVKSASDCVRLGAGKTSSLELSLSPQNSADGVATGVVVLRMTAADGSKDLDLSVPTRLEMARQVDESTRWALIAALLALAVLLPAGLLIGSNWLLARFVITSTSRTASKAVRVRPSGLQALDGGPLLEPEDFENAGFSGVRKGRRLTLDGTGITLKARRIFSLKEPRGVAFGRHGHLLVSSVMPYRDPAFNEAPAPLSVVDAAFVMINPTGATPTEADATLVMVVPDGVDRQGIRDRAARMSSVPDWGKLLAEVAATDASPPRPVAEPASTYEQSAAHVPTTGSDAGEPPPLPWEWADGAARTSTPDQSKRPRLRKKTPPGAASPSHSSTATSASTDDTLPPLPDFLK